MMMQIRDIVSRLRWSQWAAVAIGVIMLILCAIGALFDPVQFFQSYLFAYLSWVGVGLGCLAILMIQFAVKGTWGLVVRRMVEAGALTLPLMAVLFIPLIPGLSSLYQWAQPQLVAKDALLQGKAAYLNVPFFLLRTAIYFVIWGGLAFVLNRWSAQEDRADDPGIVQRLQNLSIVGLVLFGITVTFAMIDWVMSLEPHWYSTIYSAMAVMGGLLAALALAVVGVALLRLTAEDKDPLEQLISPQVLNDLGNLLMAGLLMWAYLDFSQYLVIWSGNLNDEIPWYLRRIQNGWEWVALLLIVFHFLLPFAVLLARHLKRDARSLGLIALLLFVMHVVDSFWLVAPAFHPDNFSLSWLDFTAILGIGGLWFAVFFWQLQQKPLLALHSTVDVSYTQEAAAND